MGSGEVTLVSGTATGVTTERAVQSVQRAARILGCFSRERPELGVTDLSRELGLHKSTVSRLLTALRDEGLVTQVAATGKYRLGVKVLEMAGVVLASLDLSAVADPPMRVLGDATGETVSLVVLEDGLCVDLHTVASRHPVHAVRRPGHSAPALSSAGGRILVAFRAAGSTSLGADGGNAPAANLALARILEAVREAGYALVQGEVASDLVELAAPVYDHRGWVVAALTVSAPAYRLAHDQLDGARRALLRTARSISERLGHRA